MTDYITWLLNEEDDEEEDEAEAPALDWDGARPLPRSKSAEAAEAAETDGVQRTPAAGPGAETTQEAAPAEALPPWTKRAGETRTDIAAEARAAGLAVQTEGLARALTLAARPFAGKTIEGRAAADFYARLTEGHRQARLAASPQWGGAITLPERAAGPGEPPGLDIAALDRCFERDARRYDSGADW